MSTFNPGAYEAADDLFERKIPPVPIEKVPYSKGFRLEDGKNYEIWQLVNTGEGNVSRNKPLQIKDTHGNIRSINWGTLVYPLS